MGPACLAAASCGAAGAGGDDAAAAAPDRSAIRIIVITHGQPSDPFWSVVVNGVRSAAADLGVKAEYQAPASFDMVAMGNLIDAAVASRPAGLVVSIPDPDALGPSIRAAVAAGIPVVSINSGDDAWRGLGLLTHVGQTEYDAGRAAGERLAAAGARRALCVNHEVGNAALDLRCRGLADALKPSAGGAAVLAVDLADPDDTQQRIAGALRRDTAIDAVLTLGPAAVGPALAAVDALGRSGDLALATFDLTPGALAAIRRGDALFAIDQQQFLQGYLPIVILVKYLETGAIPGGGGMIRTGPGFVTREDVDRVLELAEKGIR